MQKDPYCDRGLTLRRPGSLLLCTWVSRIQRGSRLPQPLDSIHCGAGLPPEPQAQPAWACGKRSSFSPNQTAFQQAQQKGREAALGWRLRHPAGNVHPQESPGDLQQMPIRALEATGKQPGLCREAKAPRNAGRGDNGGARGQTMRQRTKCMAAVCNSLFEAG